MFKDRIFRSQGVNQYVPGMQWSTTLDVQLGSLFSLGKPIVAPAASSITWPANDTGVKQYLPAPLVFTDTPYGRNVVVGVTTAPTGAATAINVFGEDYLGQPMTETFVLAGATGKKAFYRVLGMTILGGTTVAAVLTVARGGLLGLPFKGTVEYAREGTPPVTIDPGTVFAKCVLPDVTDPATGTTGDTRGTYLATATFDGVKEIIVNMRPDTSINTSNNGGLHGIRQYNV